MGAFVGVDGFEVHDMADDMVFIRDAVAAVHVSRFAGDGERFAAIVALEDGDGRAWLRGRGGRR